MLTDLQQRILGNLVSLRLSGHIGGGVQQKIGAVDEYLRLLPGCASVPLETIRRELRYLHDTGYIRIGWSGESAVTCDVLFKGHEAIPSDTKETTANRMGSKERHLAKLSEQSSRAASGQAKNAGQPKTDVPRVQVPGNRQPLRPASRPESAEVWRDVKVEFGITKKGFAKKIGFVRDRSARAAIFRDIEDSFTLSRSGFPKPAVILAGGVIEELLRLYLKSKSVSPKPATFEGYITACEKKGLLKKSISRLSDSLRHFRNLVHLSREKTPKHKISVAAAKVTVGSIFTIANDF